MPKPYPLELRVRVIAAIDKGMPVEVAAETFAVCERTIWDWLARRKATGDVSPTVGKVGRKPLLEPFREQLLGIIDERPDATLREMAEQLPIEVGKSCISATLHRWGVTYKKSRYGRRSS